MSTTRPRAPVRAASALCQLIDAPTVPPLIPTQKLSTLQAGQGDPSNGDQNCVNTTGPGGSEEMTGAGEPGVGEGEDTGLGDGEGEARGLGDGEGSAAGVGDGEVDGFGEGDGPGPGPAAAVYSRAKSSR